MPIWHSEESDELVPFGSGVGIDRLSVYFPVGEVAPANWFDREMVGRDGWSRSVQVPTYQGGPSVFVGAQERRVPGKGGEGEQVRRYGKVECNPARFTDPDGCSLFPLARVHEAVAVMWAAAGEYMAPQVPDASSAKVARLDLARDFREVTNPALYVRGLAPIRRPYARRSFVYNDPKKGAAETLFVGSNAGGVRLYDQHQAYAEKGAPEGSVRWEMEGRTDWLRSAGIEYTGDLDSGLMLTMAKQRWEWSAMGTHVTGPVSAVELLQREVHAGHLGQAVADRLLGSMVRQAFGYGEATSRRSEFRYRAISEKLGMTAEALWSNDLSTQALGRLDFETGTEVLALGGGS